MPLVVPNSGERLLLSYLVNNAVPSNLKLHLYVNDYIPDEGSTLANFTECAAAGYAPITLTGANWTITTDTNGVTTASYPEVTFTITSGTTIYGYYVTDNTDTQVVWAERFSDAPHQLPSGGGTERIVVKIRAD